MSLFRVTIVIGFLLAPATGLRADPSSVVHYAPEENLEQIDVSLIDDARVSFDMAAYVLTDWPVMNAIDRAARRGVKVRLYLDGSSIFERTPSAPLHALLGNPGVSVRVKRTGAPLMHLKSYQVDGRLLRTGAANFSASGLKRQDNDLIVIESAAAVARFLRRFDEIYAGGESVQHSFRWSRSDAASPHERRDASLPPAISTIPD
jgi:phosphatidylserine/phosphatidylglycerophosphate/cardiolipin synthase-like enzyme